MSKSIIEPKVLKGFRDYLPNLAILRNSMISTLQEVFSSFGFVPIDTPALEYTEILLGKGSQETDKQLFRFNDQGGRDVAMRFDLTVPLARYAAQHINELGTPFKRFHIAPVWRAEKPQRGRYREFIQCDIDIIGVKSVLADAEIINVFHHAFNALQVAHRFRINNRQILNGFLASLQKQEASVPVLRAIDKLDKLGEDVVREELGEVPGLSTWQISQVFSFLSLSRSNLNNRDLIIELRNHFLGNDFSLKGVSELESVLLILSDVGVGDNNCKIDLSIARGLDYYTGTVLETTCLDLPEIGSICSGGRYDDLASLYTKKELPGVGASLGLDRLLGAFEALEKLPTKSSTAQVLVTVLDPSTESQCVKIANHLRNAGVNTELSLEVGKLGNQIKYANKKGIEFVVIAGSQELSRGVCSIKNLANGKQQDGISLEKVAAALKDQM